MKTRSKQPLSIYIHIPFCKQKCLYCDFLSAPFGFKERESYVKALLREISLMAEACREYQVISVFFGGGTPSLLGKSQMERIMSAIRKDYELMENAEITVECNPATATFDKLKAYRLCGINRLSIGLQSASDTELKELGRIHTYRQFLETYENARKAGFKNINVDIMSALPGQTLSSYLDTVDKVAALKPEHISAYSLIIEEGTPYFSRYGEKTDKKYPPLPDEDTERRMYDMTNSRLQKAGFQRYEISNFAKKGRECRHNLTYWNGTDYVGLGVGASSYFQGYRYKNTSDVYKYKEILFSMKKKKDVLQIPCVTGDDRLHEDIQKLSVEEKMEEFLFLGLRLKKGVSVSAFQMRFGRTIDEIYGNVIESCVREKLLIRKNDRLYLSKRGTDVANYVMAQFLLS